MKDHTGREINLGDRILIDGGHIDDWYGTVIIHENHLSVRYDDDGDIVPLRDISAECEIIGS